MLQSLVQRFAYAEFLVSLEDLRSQLAERLAILLLGVCLLAIWPLLRIPFPIIDFLLVLALAGMNLLVLRLIKRSARLARHLLTWGTTLIFLVIMLLFPASWLPFLAMVPILIGAMLVRGSELLIGTAIFTLASWLVYTDGRNYHLPALLIGLLLKIGIAWLILHTLYTALEWAFNTQQRANRLLEEVRTNKAELSRTLKSLALANSQLHRTERELIAARKQAEDARRTKEQFAANISHELRTPLNLILGFSEMMYTAPDIYGDVHWTPPLRRDIYQIHRNSRHLIGMIDDILVLSRFEMAGFTFHKEPTALLPLLQNTADIVADLFRRSPVQLLVKVPDQLPTLEIDRTRIRQVLLNLLNNALRFTEKGTVCLEAEEQDKSVVITVKDTGPGIPADKLAHIFDEFYQVDLSLRRGHGGAGLGLAISKYFVEAHNGRIWAESQEGIGSKFFVSLPASGQYIPLSRLQLAQPVEHINQEPRPSLLVIDPDPHVSSFIGRYLEEYTIIPLVNAERLHQEILYHHPRAVIYNVNPGKPIPIEDLSIPVPVVQCSIPSQAWLTSELAVVDSLTKPITPQQLLDTITQIGAQRGNLGNSACNILIIDDDRGFIQLVSRILESASDQYQLRHAYNGMDGLAAMKVQRPDLLLLDLIMPELDGFQVLEQMRQDIELADVPVLILTATSYTEDAVAQHGNRIVIQRADGLRQMEILRCLEAVIERLQPHYDERSAPATLSVA